MMKKALIFLAALTLAMFYTSCERQSSGSGSLKLSLTDSPVDSSNVDGVYIKITGIQVNSTDGWKSLEGFTGPETYNLLDLTRGQSSILGNVSLVAGDYRQIRFILDAPEKGSSNHSNPGSYIRFKDGTSEPLFVPSGAQSGYKAVGEFSVPVNDTINIMADFDVRKSVVKAGESGKFILKPTIRLVVENQAGTIRGSVTNIPENTQIVIYTYADGVYTPAEAAEPAGETPRFPNAISSDRVDNLGIYHLSYLAEGTYDLIVTTQVNGAFGEVLGIIENVAVNSRTTTTQDIDINLLK